MLNRGVLLVWGPPRSGTTWMYNVLREMLGRAEIQSLALTNTETLPGSSWPGGLICKSHRAGNVAELSLVAKTAGVYPIVMLRAPARAFQSLVRTQHQDRETLLTWLEADVAALEQALPELPWAVVCREEWIRDQAALVIRRLASLIGVPLPDDECGRIASDFQKDRVRDYISHLAATRRWPDDFDYYDPFTHWHANHIDSDTERVLALSEDEGVRLEALGTRVDALTDSYSLLSAHPPATESHHDLGFSPAHLFMLLMRNPQTGNSDVHVEARPSLSARIERRRLKRLLVQLPVGAAVLMYVSNLVESGSGLSV